MKKRFPRCALGGAAGIALLVFTSWAVASWDVTRRKIALSSHIEDERAVLSERSRALTAAMDEIILETAATPYPGDRIAPSLTVPEARFALFTKPMLYVRAALPEVSRLDAIGAAVRRSDKDTFALCLVKPPASDAPDDVHAAATRHWLGSALLDDATHDIVPLQSVHRGLRPLTRAFAAELAESDSHLAVRRLEEEYELRSPISLALARMAAAADLLVVVVDELPEGAAEPVVGKSLTATRRPAILPGIEDTPHFVRAAVWSAEKREVILRIRTRVDATASPSRRSPPANAAVHGCQAAMALREARPSRP